MSKPILCVDFDGVIHSYSSGWTRPDVVSDPPVPGALRWLWKATEWFDVQIYSSRSSQDGGIDAMISWLENFALHEWGDADFVHQFLSAMNFPTQKPPAFLTIDDRALTFEGDWSEIEPADLLNFKPWNKRSIGATGTFPQGQLNDDDQGGLKIGIAYDKLDGIVRIDFGKPVAWLGLPPPEAIALAKVLIAKAKGRS